MRIVLATSDSRGDVQPMIALSLGLKNTGRDVLLIGPPEKNNGHSNWGVHIKVLAGMLPPFYIPLKIRSA